jgi:type I restriction enzyme S subunit
MRAKALGLTLAAEATRALALLDHLERSILTRAFRGELVPQDPADEPASVSLARSQEGAPAAPRSRRPRQAA